MPGLGLGISQVAVRGCANLLAAKYPGHLWASNFRTGRHSVNGTMKSEAVVYDVSNDSDRYVENSAGLFLPTVADSLHGTDNGLFCFSSDENFAEDAADATSWQPISATLTNLNDSWSIFKRVSITTTDNWNRAKFANRNLTAGDKVAVTVIFEQGTSGKARILCRDETNIHESHVKGNVGTLVYDQSDAGTISDVVQTNIQGDIWKVTCIFDAGDTGYYSFALGPNSDTDGETIIALGADIKVSPYISPLIYTSGSAVTADADDVLIDIDPTGINELSGVLKFNAVRLPDSTQSYLLDTTVFSTGFLLRFGETGNLRLALYDTIMGFRFIDYAGVISANFDTPIAFTFGPSGMNVGVNGVVATRKNEAITGPIDAGVTQIALGQRVDVSDEHFNGRILEGALFAAEATDARLLELMALAM